MKNLCLPIARKSLIADPVADLLADAIVGWCVLDHDQPVLDKAVHPVIERLVIVDEVFILVAWDGPLRPPGDGLDLAHDVEVGAVEAVEFEPLRGDGALVFVRPLDLFQNEKSGGMSRCFAVAWVHIIDHLIFLNNHFVYFFIYGTPVLISKSHRCHHCSEIEEGGGGWLIENPTAAAIVAKLRGLMVTIMRP